ncbi:nitroreductase family protein [uncultured Dysosmobacter sp.]|uniref:nitroreductase family protein n=1 Tax=uncultured Dysosmobacter sp. TaxID=2591384 RepID=UPI0026209E81|nr:nitroreductase family protein [uncultured Dysosmobacter sp.]
MGLKNQTLFSVDTQKCIGCGLCQKVCAGMVLHLNEACVPVMDDFDEYGWGGCWRCEHCLAVCPVGAISIFGKTAGDCPAPPDAAIAEQFDRLVANRRSCRRYKKKNVDPALIRSLVSQLQNAPTGGNAQMVEYTIVDDMEVMDHIRRICHDKMEEQARQGIYGYNIGAEKYAIMEASEERDSIRPGDGLFCNAPHIFIAHAKLWGDCWDKDQGIDCDVTSTYFELLCTAHGLGAGMMTYTMGVLQNMPEILRALKIPEDHYVGAVVGFGYPEINYARGVLRQNRNPVHYIMAEDIPAKL